MKNNYNEAEKKTILSIKERMKKENLVFISLYKIDGFLVVDLAHSYYDDGYYAPMYPEYEIKLTRKTPFNQFEEGLAYNKDEILDTD
jgi:hypothetical protein